MKIDLSFTEISERIREFNFPESDAVIGIGNGGIVPAGLIAFHLQKPLIIISISYRDENNNPLYKNAEILRGEKIPDKYKNILIVDDVSVSGSTLKAAKELYKNKTISTFVLKGKADYVLFPEISACVNWPWK